MAHLKIICLLALVLCLAYVHGAVRVQRSPQFGSFSQANAQAQSGGFGSRGPGFGSRPPIFGGLRRPGGGGSISISKSVSISAGRGGAAQSSAGSSAFGK